MLVFIQGEEANPFLDLIEETGYDKCLEQLRDYIVDCPEITDSAPYGSSDTVIDFDNGFILSYNSSVGYVSLTQTINRNVL